MELLQLITLVAQCTTFASIANSVESTAHAKQVSEEDVCIHATMKDFLEDASKYSGRNVIVATEEPIGIQN